MKKILFTQLLLLVTLVWGFAQTTVTLTSSKDNTIFESPTGVLSSGAGGEVITGRTNAIIPLLRRALMQFDVSSIPSNATITSASLKLQMTKTSSGSFNVGLHAVASDWGEGASNSGTGSGSGTGAMAMAGDATWVHTASPSSSWTTVGGDFDATASATLAVNGLGSYTWASTAGLVADVQSWVTNGATNFGWAIIGDESVNKTTKHFVTKEGTNAAFRPELSITYTVPVTQTNALILTGIYDGPVSSKPKGYEFYVAANIADLSVFGVGAANNGGGTDGVEYTFPAVSATAGQFIYLANDTAAFRSFFGFGADYEQGLATGINGNDAVELFENGVVIDLYGDANVNGTGTAWDYVDTWAYRNCSKGPDSTFSVSDWTIAATNMYDGNTSNATSPNPMPIGSYNPVCPAPVLIANDDVVAVPYNTATTYSPLANDITPSALINAYIVANPTKGTVVFNPLTGQAIYTPNTNVCGTDMGTYAICDINGCDTATVTFNIACPIPVYNIGLVNTVDATTGVADSLTTVCELRGVVYGGDLDGNAGLSFTLIDATGGINVFNFNDVDNYVVTQGDSIHVVGTISQYNGLTQITATSVTLISQGNTINMPTVVTTLDESTESQLVRINGLTVVSGWNTSGSFNATLTDGTNTYSARIDADLIASSTIPVGTFDLIGIGGQFDNSNPHTSGYQIFPRDTSDIILAPVLVSTVEFAMGAVTVNENAGTVTADVTIVNPTMTATTVDVMLDMANSTATNGVDFNYTSPTTLTFPANSTMTQSVTITITDDAMMESNETIVLNLMNATTGVTIGGTAMHTITINDNDATIPNVVINEIHYNQPGLDSLEYIELYNNSGSVADLQGWNFTQGVDYTFPAITLAAGDYLVLTNDSTAMQNAYGVTAYQWTSGSLSNGGEDVVIRTANGIEVDSMEYDDVSPWSTLADGFGYGLELCDPNTDNLDPANWNIGATALNVSISGTPMFGTPGAANVCFVPAANPYPLRSVEEMTMVDMTGVADSLNQGCELRGVVYGIDYDGDAGLSFTMIGEGFGINVFNFNDVSSYMVNEGDSIHVQGLIAQYNGLLEIIADSISVEGTETINSPTIVTAFDETTESQFIKLETVTLVDATQWTSAGSGFNVDVRNTTDTFAVRIDNDCDLFAEVAPVGWFNITGLGGQFDNSSPYTSGYQLFPRNQGDIELLINTNEPKNLSGQIKLFPNPTNGLLNIVSEVKLTAVRITNVLGQEVMNMNNVNTQTSLNVSHLTNGVYIITFMTEEGVWSEQFVKN
jgi:DNA/RNA endonuclease YhcR with UshA esterase domain